MFVPRVKFGAIEARNARKRMWVLALSGILCHAALNGLGRDSSGSVYRLIAERNVFGLRGPPIVIVDPPLRPAR